MLAVALVALGANVGSVLLLRRHDEQDVNVRSAFLHLAQDALASLAVVIAALLAGTSVGAYVDPAAALLVGAAVLRGALSLVWETVRTLLEATPDEVDLPSLVSRVGERFAPARIHHLHVWEIGPGQRVLTAHVDLGQDLDGRRIEELFGAMKVFLEAEWGVNHATLEPEVIGCGNGDLLGRWDQSPRAAGTVPSPFPGDRSSDGHGPGEAS
jgi:cobalt-zinc-cadmium efflux system protein